NLRMLFEKKIDLFELTFSGPEFHIIIAPDGKTNIPSPARRPGGNPVGFEISITNFSVVGGAALLNERMINLNFSTHNVAAGLNYNAGCEVLESHFCFDGILDRPSQAQRSIPYTLAAYADYTRATLIVLKISITC